jgi:hypothetical protein
MSDGAHRLQPGWHLEDLVPLLSQTIGEEKAGEVIEAAALRLGLSLSSGLPEPDVLKLLDEIAKSPGIVGITARFAKSRVHLSQRP